MGKKTEAEELVVVNWEQLGIANDFMFGKVMQDLELCKELLQRILPGIKIDHVEYSIAQKSIDSDVDAKSVRLDVYVKDDENVVYDIEMQVTKESELPKRTRYYQSSIDMDMLEKGRKYKQLSQSYIIFICLFDFFEKGRHIYTFENICKEDTDIKLGDGTSKIFLNAKGTLDDISPELRAFLDYVAGKRPDDSFLERLEEAVKKARKNRKWRHEYMTLLMRDQENMEIGLEKGKEIGLEKGKEIGREEGRQESIELFVSALKELGITNDLIIQKLQEKFKLKQEEASAYVEA